MTTEPLSLPGEIWKPADVSIHWVEDELAGIDCVCGEYIVLSVDREADNDCPACGRDYRLEIFIRVTVNEERHRIERALNGVREPAT